MGGTIDYSKRNHIVATFNNGAIALYVNGTPISASPEILDQTRNFANLLSGYFNITDGTFGVDEVRIYNRALTASEVKALYLYPAGNKATKISGNQISTGRIQSNNWVDGTSGSLLDLNNELFAIKDDTFGNSGIQLMWADSKAKFYAGDGSDKYFKFDGTDLSWKGAYTELTAEGAFTASNATITGTVNASGGTFSGHVTAGTAKFGVDVTAGNDGIWLDANNYWYTTGMKATAGTVGGFTLSSTSLASGSHIVLDATSGQEAISIKSASFGSDGIQLEYNEGTPRFYVGDGADEYLKYVKGTGLSLSTAQANAITVKSGGSIEIEYGGDILLTHGGDIKFTSVDAPTACTATLIATETGNVDNGSHSYKITYVNDTGETELGAASNSVTVDDTHKQVSLTDIPTSSSGSVTKRKIYRTKAGGSDYYYLATINDNTTTTYTDNTADANLGTEISNNRRNDTYGKVIIDNKVCLDIGKNVFVGNDAGKENTVGYYNAFLGYYAGYHNTSGTFNTFLGDSAAYRNTTGGGNVFVGYLTGQYNTEGFNNVFIGREAGDRNTTGYDNVFLGTYAGYYNQTGSRNICLGYNAGAENTGSDALIVDNRARGSSANEQAKSILYGTMADAPANQTLRINAATTVSQNLTLASGTSVNEFSTDTTLAGNSDDAVPTEKAVKQYVDGGSRAGLPAFLVHKTTAQNNIAVNSTVDVTFETEIYDQGNDFSSSTFTAPATGKYHFDVSVTLSQIDTSATEYRIQLVTSNRTYYKYLDPNFIADLSYPLSLQLSVDVDMDANDTAKVQVYQLGGAQQTDIVSGEVVTWFSGHRIA